MTMQQDRRANAKAREEATPYVDELTAHGTAREDMPTQSPPAVEDAPPGVAEVGPGYMRIYKRVEYGWKPVVVSRGAVEACIESGFRFECGDCGGHCGLGPNDCPTRAKMKFTRCPAPGCSKRLYDTAGKEEETDLAPPDPDEIRLIAEASTPEARLRVKLNRHLRYSHLAVAEELGVGPDPLLVPNAHALAGAMQPAVPFPVHPSQRTAA